MRARVMVVREGQREKKSRETSWPFFLTPTKVREDTYRIAGIASEAYTRVFAGRHSKGSRECARAHARMYVRAQQRVKRAVMLYLRVYIHVHIYRRHVTIYQSSADLRTEPRHAAPRASRAYTCNFDVAIVRRPRRLTSL